MAATFKFKNKMKNLPSCVDGDLVMLDFVMLNLWNWSFHVVLRRRQRN